MKIADIKEALFRQAIVFDTGGFRSTEDVGESWIGKVMWGKDSDVVPSRFDPLATFFLHTLPFVPDVLSGYQLITVYVDFDVYNHLIDDNLAPYFWIQCYSNLDGLQKINQSSSVIRSFPLTSRMIVNDAPQWEDECNIPPDIQHEILQREFAGEIEYYDDIFEDVYYMHKIGGYPSYTQGGVHFGDDYPFVFQISSDEKARFNIVDCGSFYFFHNSNTREWVVHCDFY